jgi:hypothetical protein
MILRPTLVAVTLLLAGCDLEALLADPKVVQREADAKAIGGACRFGLRSIEDCYMMNEKASKSAVFMGWKDMDQYMRDNKVEGIPAKLSKPNAPVPVEEVITEDKPAEGPAKDKADAKGKDKAKPASEKPPEKAAAGH